MKISMMNNIPMECTDNSHVYDLREENGQQNSPETLGLLSINSASNTYDEIVVIEMCNLDSSKIVNDSEADENYNVRAKKLKETTKLLRSISNPGQTSLPYTVKEKCTYYDMEPRDRQFVSWMVVVTTTFIIFVLTIIIVFYILTER